jgi:hypothetical protein
MQAVVSIPSFVDIPEFVLQMDRFSRSVHADLWGHRVPSPHLWERILAMRRDDSATGLFAKGCLIGCATLLTTLLNRDGV